MAGITLSTKLHMNSGYEIPILGYGVYQTPADVCEEVMSHALKVGYRHVDSAISYRNERPCGEAIRKSGIPRSEIFYTSKIPCRKLSYENTKQHIVKSLTETGFDYIDLMLIHAPYGGRVARKGAWKALSEAQKEGKIRSLGISNYGLHHLEEMETYTKELKDEGSPSGIVSVGQWELHPWMSRPKIIEWCKQRGVILEAFSPLIRGTRLEEEQLKILAKNYGKTAAQILVRWSLQKGFVPLPKSVTPSRIEKNADVFDFELTPEEVEALETDEYSPCTWDPTTSSLEQ